MPYLSQICRISGQYSSGGTITPPPPMIGSPIKAAMLSGPSNSITCSNSSRELMRGRARRHPREETEGIGRADMEEAGQEGLEARLARVLSGRAERAHRPAVVAAVARDDFRPVLVRVLLLHVLARDFQRRLDRLRAAVDEDDVIERAGQIPARRCASSSDDRRGPGERCVGQLAHLLRRRLDQPLLPEADIDAPEPGHRVNVFLAGFIHDRAAVPRRPSRAAVAGARAA